VTRLVLLELLVWTSLIFFVLFSQYVTHTHGICEDGDDSAEVIYKHHSFLLSQMIMGKEGVQWTETNIFKHLCEKFPVRHIVPDTHIRHQGF